MKIAKRKKFFIIWLWIASLGLVPVAQGLDISIADICNEFLDLGFDCNYQTHHGVYKYGPYDPFLGGMGRIRQNAAYCLIRDGHGKEVPTLENFAGLPSGATSRFHIVYAGKQPSQVYRAKAQRILDITLLGVTLRGAELQNFDARFPVELAKKLSQHCPKKSGGRRGGLGGSYGTGFGAGAKPKICTPYLRSGHYIDLETESHSLDIDFDLAGFEFNFERDWPYNYFGTTLLQNPNLTDGIIPADAGNNNSWEWGNQPNLSQTATTLVELVFPPIRASAFSFKLKLKIGPEQGYYVLREGPDPENPGSGTAFDPDFGQVADYASAIGGYTSTGLATSANAQVDVKVCIDLGWLGTWCADFTIIQLADKKNIASLPFNWISYEPSGKPLKAKWKASNQIFEGSNQVKNQINNCLAEPPMENPPEEVAAADDWVNFANGVGEAFDDNYHVCQIETPEDDVSIPSFKLCDNQGNVYEPNGPAYKQDQLLESPLNLIR